MHHRAPIVLNMVVATLWLGAAAAQAQPHAADRSPGDSRSPSQDGRAVRARVTLPGGAPAAGAIVLTPGGAQAVTDSAGEAELRLEAFASDRVRLSTAWTEGGETYLGSVEVDTLTATVAAIALARGVQCEPEWLPTFGGEPGTDGVIYTLAVFDDGSGDGPALFVGGDFNAAGGLPTYGVARWNGEHWTNLGSGTIRAVRAMTVFDDGSGEALYVGGEFATIGGVSVDQVARWDGAAWSAVGSGMEGFSVADVFDLAVFDDGGGPRLYAAGEFQNDQGQMTGLVARWDGADWISIDAGPDRIVRALIAHDDGSGAALYAGGDFETVGGAPAPHVARWNGSSWSAVGAGLDDDVLAFAVYDEGAGPALFAGGRFVASDGASAPGVARWNGAAWSALGAGVAGEVRGLHAHDDGSGPALFAAGTFTTAGGAAANRVAKWDGASWSPLANGVNLGAETFATYDDGAGARLFAAGSFFTADGVLVNRIGAWDGAAWSAVGRGAKALNGDVHALAVFDDGSGPALYAGGYFTLAGDLSVSHIARWDGKVWSALGAGLDHWVFALAVHDDGDGPALFVGGAFDEAGGVAAPHIAKWDGASWSALGTGMSSDVMALMVFDDGDGPALIAGGAFALAGGVFANRVAKWREGAWSPMGYGLTDFVYTLGVFDAGTGSGPELYAGGAFNIAQGASADYIARWNGASWSSVGGGADGNVFTMAGADLGDGPALYIGGTFDRVGGMFARGIARWDGAAWSSLPHIGDVRSLLVYDDGSGVQLFAGSYSLRAWNGAVWTTVNAPGLASPAALAAFDDGSGEGPALYVGGDFMSSPAGDSNLARRSGCAQPPCPADLNGDGQVDMADLMLAIDAFNTTPNDPAYNPAADANGDNAVDFADLNLVLSAFNTAC